MPKIFDHGEPRVAEQNFLPPFHAPKARQRVELEPRGARTSFDLGDTFRLDRVMRSIRPRACERQPSGRGGHGRIARIEETGHRPANGRPRLTAPSELERRPRGVLRKIANSSFTMLPCAHANDTRPR